VYDCGILKCWSAKFRVRIRIRVVRVNHLTDNIVDASSTEAVWRLAHRPNVHCLPLVLQQKQKSSPHFLNLQTARDALLCEIGC